MILSVAKGYEYLWYLIRQMPVPYLAAFYLVFGLVAFRGLFDVIKWFLSGGD